MLLIKSFPPVTNQSSADIRLSSPNTLALLFLSPPVTFAYSLFFSPISFLLLPLFPSASFSPFYSLLSLSSPLYPLSPAFFSFLPLFFPFLSGKSTERKKSQWCQAKPNLWYSSKPAIIPETALFFMGVFLMDVILIASSVSAWV